MDSVFLHLAHVTDLHPTYQSTLSFLRGARVYISVSLLKRGARKQLITPAILRSHYLIDPIGEAKTE